MNKQVRIYAAIGIVIILFGLFFATYPFERQLIHREYTPLEAYPTYYYTNFTVASSELNPELSFDLDLDTGDNYTDCIIIWALYNLSLDQFEDIFNSTIMQEAMSSGDWDPEDFNAIWAGWFAGLFFPHWNSVPPGEYVFVFWIEPDSPITGWSATFTASLRTRLLILY